MIELTVALGAGLVSFLSPCVLPLIPGYISYISGSSLNELVEKKSLKVEKEQMNKQLIAKMVKSPINYNQNRKPSEESFLINGLYKKANVIDNRKLLQLNVRN